MRIYHYTTIDTLALILSTKTVKFNRLDKVDDLDEGKVSISGTPLSHFYFASCWSSLKQESIPMWRMYTNRGVGVRISVESEMLFDPILHDSVTESDLWGIVNTLNNKHYLEIPLIMSRHVTYDKNPETIIQNNIIPYSTNEPDIDILAIKNDIVGFTKNEDWAFQHEFRFLKMVLPRDHKTTNILPSEKYNFSWPETWHLIKSGQQPEKKPGVPLDFILVPIGKHAFETIEILLGPECKLEHRIIVDALCKSNSIPRNVISESRLGGHVKFK